MTLHRGHRRADRRARRSTLSRHRPFTRYPYAFEKLEVRTLLSAIVSGQTIAGSITTGAQQDVYTFAVAAGNTFQLTVGDANAQSNYRSQMTVLNPNSVQIAAKSDGFTGGSVNETYNVPAGSGGTYTVIVQSVSGNLGAYDLELAVAPSVQAVDADGDGGVIQSGQGNIGAINHYGDLDVYTFNANAGNTFRLSVGDAPGSDYRAQLTVYDPNGSQVGTDADGFTGGSAAVTYHVSATGSGMYTVIVQNVSGANLGAYELDLALAPAAQTADLDGDSGTILSGQTKAGTINHYGDLDVYTFNANAGNTFRLSVGDANNASDFRSQITVYDPNGTQVGTAADGFTRGSVAVTYNVSATGSGMYTVVVQSFGGGNLGAYDLDFVVAPATQATDSDGDGGAILSGQGNLGTINHYGDLDVYTFNANAGNTFRLSAGDAPGSDFRSQITVYDPNGTQVGTDADGFSGGSAAVTYHVSATGSGMYTVIVQSAGGANLGAYELDLALAPAIQAPDLNGDGGTIFSGQGRTGTINYFGDLDVYTFNANAGNTFRLSAGDVPGSDVRSQITVYDPGGTQVGTAADGFSGGSAAVTYNVSATGSGMYTVVVQSFNGANLGAYELDLALAPAPQAGDLDGDGGTILSGQTKAGTINHYGDLDVYTFNANSGNTFRLSVGDATPASDFRSQITVYDPNGTQVGTSADGFTGGSVNVTYNVSATGSGMYTVVVQSFAGNNLGAYDLDLVVAPASQAVDSDGDGGLILSGQGKAGSINHYGDLDVYTFNANAGNTFRLSAGDANAASDYRSQITVYDPNGTQVGTASDSFRGGSVAVTYNVSATGSGMYTVIVQNTGGGNLGAYNLDLALAPATQAVDPDGDGGTIISGQTKTGTINHYGDLDVYTFSGTAGNIFKVTVADANAASDYRPQFTVYDPNGTQVAAASNGFTNASINGTYTIPAGGNGTYTVVVQSTSGGNLGAYVVQLLQAPATGVIVPGPIAIDVPTPGRINTSGGQDSWTFYGNAGRTLTIFVNPGSSAAASLPAPFTPVLNWANVSLIAPDGTTVLANQNATTLGQALTLNALTLPTSGTYTIKVTAATAHATSTGNYVLAAYDVTPNVQSLSLNQKVVGNIAVPFAYDQYTFSAPASTQVQFNLAAGSSGALTYTLSGPNGISVFSNATASSGLINLPTTGTYTLTVQGVGGQTGKYGFTLASTSVTNLSLGTPFTGTSSGNGQVQLFAIPVSGIDPISIALTDPNASDHNEIFASFGQPPTLQSYDYGVTATGANQTILIPNGKPTTLYVLVDNEAVKSGPDHFTLTVNSSSVILTGATPDQGAANAPTVMTLTGVGFGSGSTVNLVAGDGTLYPATTASIDLPTQITATFAPGSVPAGVYSVRVSQNGSQSQLHNVLTMAASGSGSLSTRLEIPSLIGNHIAATLYVDYENTGTVAIPAPLLILDATRPNNAGPGDVHGAFLTTDPTLITSGYWTSALPQGYSTSIEILASGKTPGVLEPGETARIPIYYAGWLRSQWNVVNTSMNFTLSAIEPDDASPVDWATLLQDIQPDTVSPTAWGAISSNLLTQLGPTAGGYVGMLDASAAYLGHLGENVNDVQSLWNFSMAQADAALSAVGPVLTSQIDDTLIAPGTSITFSRSFSNTITGRNTLGLLGFGWSTPWETHATIAGDGTVTIYGQGDMQEIFQPDSRYSGVYFSQTGDHSNLTADGAGGYLLTDRDGNITDFSASGVLKYLQDPNGNRITASYTTGRLTGLTHSSGQSLTIAYNGSGLVSSITDSAGRTTTYAYNGSEQLTSVQDYAGQTTTYAYAATSGPKANALSTITSPGGVHSFFTYDAQGRLSATSSDGNAAATSYTYNQGAVTTTDALGNAGTLYFDGNGQIAKTVDPLGIANYFTYDSYFNLTKITGPTGLTENYTYDSHGNVLSSADGLGNISHYTYGPNGRLLTMVDAKGNHTTYAYDAAGNLLKTTYADGTSSSASFDPLGDPLSFINQKAQVTAYTFNNAGQLTGENLADGSTYAFAYDADGNLSTATDSTGTTTFTYDTRDRLTAVQYPGSLSLAFTYNADDQRTQIVDQSGFTTNYHYDAAGRLTGLTDGAGASLVAYTYDAASQLVLKVNGNGSSTSYAYDADGNVIHLINHASDGTTVNSRFDYTYDPLGNLTTETTSDGTWTYNYDGDGQLTHAVFASTNANITSQDLRYTYDAAGNRATTLLNGVTTTYLSNSMNEYTKVGNTTFTYDANGNLLSDGTTAYAYSPLNQVTSLTTAGVTTTYQYDAIGLPVSITSGGQQTRYLYDPTDLGNIVEALGSGNSTQHYRYGFGLLSAINGADAAANTSYFDFDAVGSTADITNAAGAAVGKYSYLPFGGTLAATGQAAGLFTFTGQTGGLNAGNGLIVMRARVMNTTIGRFVSPDPLGLAGGDTNFYRYVQNSPTRYSDPTGLFLDVLYHNKGISDAVDAANAADRGDYGTASSKIGQADRAEELAGKSGEASGAVVGLIGTGVDAVSGVPKDPGELALFLHGEIIDPLMQKFRNFYNQHPDWFNSTALKSKLYNAYQNFKAELPNLAHDLWQQILKAVHSLDPNSKTGPNSFGPEGFVPDSGIYPYTIEFENAAIATAPAQQVNVTDQLDPNLDWTTFQLTQIGFGDTTILVPAGSQSFETTVQMTYGGVTFDVLVQAGIHTTTGQVYANFYSLDPDTGLPPSVLIGFLPPEDGTGRGQGYLSYTLSPKANLATGTQITNIANIVFDNSNAITTDQVDDEDASKGTDPAKRTLLTIDSGAPTSTVNALPTIESGTSFDVSWAGQDDASGSGIANFDVYVSEDGAAFTPWLMGTTATSSTYTGIDGHAYAFYSVAHDNAENSQSVPLAAQASTTIVTAAVSPGNLFFDQPLANASAGGTIGPSIVVDLKDSDGNLLTGDNSNVTLTIASGPDGATLLGTVTVQAQNGVATFSNLSLPKAGTYTLAASDGFFTAAISNSFDVAVGPAAKLAFTALPGFDYLGSPFASDITVAVEDAQGNLITDDNSMVTLALGSEPHGSAINGTLTVQATNGIATFSGLALSKAGVYTVQATDTGLASATSANITATLPPAKLVFKQQPKTTVAGHVIAPSVTVYVEDSAGHLVTFDDSTVTIAINKGPDGATTGNSTLIVQADHGIATFDNLILTKAGKYTLKATDSALKAIVSSGFTISPDANFAHLVLTQPPSATLVGKPLNPPIIAQVQDQYQNVVKNDHSKVTIGISSGPNGSALKGTTKVSVSNGIVKFSNVQPTIAGDYALTLTDATLANNTPVQVLATVSQGVSSVAAPKTAAFYAEGKTITLSTAFKSTAPSSVLFTGMATIVDDQSDVLGTASLSSSGKIKFLLNNVTAGTYLVVVNYAGDVNHTAIMSPQFTLTVQPA